MKRFFAIIESPVTRTFLLGLVVLSFQTTLFNTLRPFGVVLQMMLLFACVSGVVAGSETGAVAGFMFGLMYDMVLTAP
jgi:cell shape-determining protein MreD